MAEGCRGWRQIVAWYNGMLLRTTTDDVETRDYGGPPGTTTTDGGPKP